MIKKYGIYIVVLILLSVASAMIYVKLNPKKLPSNLISATGKIDGDLIALNTKYPGRIQSITIDDGDKINKNKVIATLKSDEYNEQLNAVLKDIKAVKYSIEAMRYELNITKKNIFIDIKKAEKVIDIANAKKNALLDSMHSLQSLVKQDIKDYKRDKNLFKSKLLAKQKFEYIKLKLTTDRNKLKALKDKLTEVNKSIETAKYNLQIALSQKDKILALKAKIKATKSKMEALKAKGKQVQAVINEMTITSPIDGYIMEKVANKGEVLGAGSVIATLKDPKSLYLKVFVDTINNGKIKIGDKAVIFLDAYPNKPIKAKVTAIAANAEFTPKEVAVRSDRIQRVYAVHLKPLKPNPLLKLGIPAVGIISLNAKGLPASLNDIPSI